MESERRTNIIGAELDDSRLSDILSASQIKVTDTYETPPQIIWIDNSTIATLGNFSASTGKAKSKKTQRTCRNWNKRWTARYACWRNGGKP